MIETEDFERDMYMEEGVYESIDNDGINAFEEGFMIGYLSS